MKATRAVLVFASYAALGMVVIASAWSGVDRSVRAARSIALRIAEAAELRASTVEKLLGDPPLWLWAAVWFGGVTLVVLAVAAAWDMSRAVFEHKKEDPPCS